MQIKIVDENGLEVQSIDALSVQVVVPSKIVEPDPEEPTDPEVPEEPEVPTEPEQPVIDKDVSYFLTTDAGEGPSKDDWSKTLNIPWKNLMGDFIDAEGNLQGNVPFFTLEVKSVGEYQVDVIDLDKFEKGFFLKYSGSSSPYATIAGRLSNKAPILRCELTDGTSIDIKARATAGWASSTIKALDTRNEVKISTTNNALIHFLIPDEAVKGKLIFNVVAKGTPNGLVSIYAANPPGISFPWEAEPLMGLASQVGEDALPMHPDVLRAGDFSEESMKSMFDSLSISDNADPQYIIEEDGRTTFRGRFRDRAEAARTEGKTISWVDQNCRGSFGALVQLTKPDMQDPLRPALPGHEEMYCRLYFMMEDDWLASNDGNKMAIGWDLRLGIWLDSGYWQQTTGNGGARGTGLKLMAPAGKVNGQKVPRWEYQGHSIRMEAGKAPKDKDDPYQHLRPVTSYVYHLDQFDFNGTIERWGNAVIERGRWHCIEQYIKLNSIEGPYDQYGNGQAVANGILRTWVDGVLVGERTGMRWRRTPEISIEGPWLNWFFGGKQAADHEMHYRMKDFVCAKRYIGPRG